MSKLPTVLCAATLFTLVMVTSSMKNDHNEVFSFVIFMQSSIELDAEDIARRITETKALTSSGEYVEVIAKMKEKMSEKLKWTRDMVNDLMNDANNTIFNETQCRSYLDDFVKREQDVNATVYASVEAATEVALTRLNKMLQGIKGVQKNLENLKLEAFRCLLPECLPIKNRVINIMTHIFRVSCALSWFDQASSEPLDLALNATYDSLVKKGQDVLLNTFKCVFDGHPPRHPPPDRLFFRRRFRHRQS